MSNLQKTGVKSLSTFLSTDAIKAKFGDILGDKAPAFLGSLLSVANQNGLADADQASIYGSALIAASFDLPINPSLGFAYIVAYNTRQADGSFKKLAQFQMGAKGFKQLALRTGEYKIINETDVREGELVSANRMTGDMTFEWITDQDERSKLPIVGYLSYFEMNNGYRSTYYMTLAEIQKHGAKYSKTFNHASGNWKKNFEQMALKTVAKMNLSKNGYLSTELQRAVSFDQSSVKNADPKKPFSQEIMDITPSYDDNENFTDYEYEEALNDQIAKENAPIDAKVQQAMQQAETIIQNNQNNSKL